MATPIWNDKEKRWTLRIKKDGKEKKFTSVKPGIAGKKEVLRKARAYEDTGADDRYKAKCSVVWDRFIEDTKMRIGAKSESIRQYSSLGKLYILPAIGSKRMSTLKKEDYQKILNYATPINSKKETLSKKYLSSIRMTINLFVRFGVENGYCEPFYGSLYIPVGHPTIGKNILQPNEIKKLFEPSELSYHLALCFLVVTGLRPGEALGLKWSDIGADSFCIRRSINIRNQITDGKNKNAQRIIPLTPIVRNILDKQRDRTKHLHSEWVFCSCTGGAGVQQTMMCHMRTLCAERGFQASPYCLRHTFVSMVKNTLPEQMVKDLVGHSVSMDTFGVYGHRVNGELKQAAELIDLTFKNVQSNID